MTQKTMHSQQASSRAAPYLLHDLFEHLKLSFGGALLSENSWDMLRPQVIPSSDGGPPLPPRVPQRIPCYPTDVLRSFGPSEAPQRCRTTSRIEEGPWWILPHWKRQARLMWFWVRWRAGWYMEVSWNVGTPKSSILIGFSIINYPFWGVPLFTPLRVGWPPTPQVYFRPWEGLRVVFPRGGSPS